MPHGPGVVRKQGDPSGLRREARGARIAGPPLAPAVLASRAGDLRTALIPGRPRRLRRLDPGRAVALGQVLSRVHTRRATATGGRPGWEARVAGLTGYARARGRDAMACAQSAGERRLITSATRAAAAAADLARGPAAAFAFLHGDLIEDNVVWPTGGGDPVLVDWEFWRMGDPAEDLAYLSAINALPPEVMGHVFQGYRADGSIMARVDLWHPLVLVDAALWYRAHGDHEPVARLLDRARDALS